MRRSFAASIVCGVIVALASCGDDASDSPATRDAAIDAPPDVVEPSGDAGGDAPADTASDTLEAGSPTGEIAFSNLGGSSSEFVASFDPGTTTASGCTQTVNGSCESVDCVPVDGGGVSYASAGTLHATGGALGDAGADFMPSSGGVYYTTSIPAPLFQSGDVLGVTGSGGDVPAFGLQTVVAPGLVTLTSPASDAGTYVIPTSSDVALAWSGGLAGAKVYVQLMVQKGGGAFAEAACTFDAAPGSATIPAAALTVLAGRSGSLLVSQYRATAFTAGSYALSLRAISEQNYVATYP